MYNSFQGVTKGVIVMNRRGNGEGTIRKDKKTKKWVARYSLPNGRRPSIYGDTRAEVAEKLNKALVSIKEKKYVDKDNRTIREIQRDMLEEQEKLNKITQSTMLRNKATAKIILTKMNIADKAIQKVTADEINKGLQNLTYLSNSYIDKIYMKLNAIFNQAVLDEVLISNPFAVKGKIKKPRSNNEDKKVEAFTIEEHQRFLQQLKEKDYKHKVIFYILIRHRIKVWRVFSIKKK